MFEEYWRIVEEIVSAKGRRLYKYDYFEKLWSKLVDEDIDLIILLAPTGSGKTEAASTPLIASLRTGEPRWISLLHVLPTRSLVNMMADRYLKTISILDFKSRITTFCDHGDVPYKPFLEGDICVTTYDTLFYTFYGFRVRGFHHLLPIGKVASSILILDEVQLLQDSYWYTMRLLPSHVGNLVYSGSKVVLMSATIPSVIVEEIGEWFKLKSVPVNVGIVESRDKAARGIVEVELSNSPVEEIVKELSMEDLPSLIVCNTVGKAVQVWSILRNRDTFRDVRVELLHSRLTRKTRGAREKALLEKPENIILVATQVVEAGLDFNFKTVITEIAPIDSLIQRIGRCARIPGSKGRGIVSLNTETALKVYPSKVIERSVNAAEDVKLLEKAVFYVNESIQLVNQVYTREIVDWLASSRDVGVRLSEARRFLDGFMFKKLLLKTKDLYKKIANHIVRVGVELKCLLPGEEILSKLYERISSGGREFALDVLELTLLEGNMISLSFEEWRRREISALKHSIGGRQVYVALSSPVREDCLVKFNIISSEDLTSILRSSPSPLLILNPEYYIIEPETGYELGVVAP